MIFSSKELQEKYQDYSDPKGKIRRLVEDNKLFPIVRGLYEDDRTIAPSYLAPWICSPSYLSFDYALYLYDLIPEKVFAYTSATFGKRRRKEFRNMFGVYTYQDVPKDAYPYGIASKIDGDYSYQIATKEKALCDKLYSISPVRNIKELRYLIFDDLRIDEDDFNELDKESIICIAPLYHARNLDLLSRLVQRR